MPGLESRTLGKPDLWDCCAAQINGQILGSELGKGWPAVSQPRNTDVSWDAEVMIEALLCGLCTDR
jgi:hypothetical protein